MLKLPPYGKLPPELLREIVFKRLGARSDRVIVGPAVGEDAAIIDAGDRVMVVHVDPVTGAIENLGWLAVNVAVNDVASRGAEPLWMLIALLLREGAKFEEVDEILKQVDKAAKDLGVAVVGGHSEVVVGLTRNVAVATAIGEASKDRYVTSGGARPRDLVIVTKGACIEGSAILAYEFESLLSSALSCGELEELKSMMWKISILSEAREAIKTGMVTAMHDATEGGVLGAIQELAWASRVGVRVYEDKIFMKSSTRKLCSFLSIDPLKTISSGTLILTVRKEGGEELLKSIRKVGVEAMVVGEVSSLEEGLWLVRKDGSIEDLSRPIEEELWKVLARKEVFKMGFKPPQLS